MQVKDLIKALSEANPEYVVTFSNRGPFTKEIAATIQQKTFYYDEQGVRQESVCIVLYPAIDTRVSYNVSEILSGAPPLSIDEIMTIMEKEPLQFFEPPGRTVDILAELDKMEEEIDKRRLNAENDNDRWYDNGSMSVIKDLREKLSADNNTKQ